MWARSTSSSRAWQRAFAVAAMATAGAVVLACWPRGEPTTPASSKSAASQYRESSPIESIVPADTVVRSAAEMPAAPGGAAAPAAAFVLSGRVVVLDEHGSEHPTESGTMTLLFEERHEHDGLSTWNVPVSVERGAWTLALPIRFPEFRVQGGLLGGKGAAGSPDPIAVPDTGVVVVRVQWQVPTKLRVVASENGQDLGGVRIVTIAAHDQTKVLVPLRARDEEDGIVLVADGTSPLQFDSHSQYPQAMLWVGAKGRAWSQLLVATTDLAEHVVRLDPGGDVEIAFAGPPAPAKAFLRVRRVAGGGERVPYVGEDGHPVHGEMVAEVEPGPASSVRVNGLPVGPFEVALEMGSDYGSLQLGTAKVVVAAGATAHATIVVRDDVVVPPGVPIRGTLQLPAAANRSVSLLFQPESATRPWQAEVRLRLEDLHSIGPSLYRWDAGNLAAGEYEIEVVGHQHFIPLTVAPGQNGELTIVVPAPCEVVVKLLDADTGRLVPFGSDEQLLWTVASARLVPQAVMQENEALAARLAIQHGVALRGAGRRYRSVYLDEPVQPDGAFHFTAPPGWIEVRVESRDFVAVCHEHELVAGRNEIVLQANRACGVELVWKDGERVVDGGSIELQSADGESPGGYAGEKRCRVFAPGTFTLVATPPEGYEPVPPRSVTVVPGCWTPVEIVLQRHR